MKLIADLFYMYSKSLILNSQEVSSTLRSLVLQPKKVSKIRGSQGVKGGRVGSRECLDEG